MKLFGKTSANKQRYRCLICFKTYVHKRKDRKIDNEFHWFKLWIQEGYSIRQLIKQSGHSKNKLQRIKNYWLLKETPVLSKTRLTKAKYLLFDGTYFHKNGCLAILMDHTVKKNIAYDYIERESYYNVYPILLNLKKEGLNPIAITVDGHKTVIRAIKEVWPDIVIQRCLFHIQNQGLMWIRFYPKTQAGKELKNIVKGITNIKTLQDMHRFNLVYECWQQKYENFIKLLPKDSVANKDLQRTMKLINNALPNMFHFIKDQNIAPTTNMLESFYSQLKHQYRNHRGLSEKHKISYLKWFCYIKNFNK